MITETATIPSETPGLESGIRMKPIPAAACAARLIGLLTLGWIYLAATDLRWLLHLHAVHSRITRAPFAFRYNPYLACTIANVAAPTIAACVLLLFPAWLLRAFTPVSGKPLALNAGWCTTGIAIGLGLLVLSIHSFLATTLWTIYSSGHNACWQIELSVAALVAAGGVVLCRRILAGHRIPGTPIS